MSESYINEATAQFVKDIGTLVSDRDKFRSKEKQARSTNTRPIGSLTSGHGGESLSIWPRISRLTAWNEREPGLKRITTK